MLTLEKARIETRQPSFPSLDILARNTSLLSVLMSDWALVEREHGIAEQTYSAFAETHPVLRTTAQQMYEKEAATYALDYGVTIFEVLHSYVYSGRLYKNSMVITRNVRALGEWAKHGELDLEVRSYFDSAMVEFTNKMPQTAEIVEEAASRHHQLNVDHAVIGAAWSHKIQTIPIRV